MFGGCSATPSPLRRDDDPEPVILPPDATSPTPWLGSETQS